MNSDSKTPDTIQLYKDAFKRSSNSGGELIHLNNAGVSPWPNATLAAVQEWSTKLASSGTHAVPDAYAKSELTRSLLAKVLGATENQIAFFQTCASAISQVALGLKLKAGDEIVVWDQEYPSNFYPWAVAAERSGAKLVVAKSSENLATPLQAIEAVVTDRTRVIAVSWVQYRSGAVTDLESLSKFARARNIFTCIDAIQGLGVLPFNFNSLGIDAACGGAHKWFTSPLSIGFLLLRPEHIESLTPLSVGAITFGGTEILASPSTPMAKGISRYEPGGRCLLEFIGFGATLELVDKVGVDRIAQEAEWLARKLMHGLRERGYLIHSPHGAHFRGAILNFAPTPDSRHKTLVDVESQLRSVKVSFATRPPGIRLSPHAFNTATEIERVLEVL